LGGYEEGGCFAPLLSTFAKILKKKIEAIFVFSRIHTITYTYCTNGAVSMNTKVVSSAEVLNLITFDKYRLIDDEVCFRLFLL
jgi:hypothetical protein